jgi:Ser/Thr protein kinase RdoA (MazF antagonist)
MTRAFVDRPLGDAVVAGNAARRAAAHWGLDAPDLVRMGMNAVFAAGPFVLRVSRPSAPGEAALALHETLHSFGVAVPRPARADVVTDGDVVVTCWERVVPVAETVDWREVGEIVRRVHSIAPDALPVDYPLASPRDIPWWDFGVLLADTADLLDAPARAGIDAALERRAGWEQWEGDGTNLVVCHGDVHPGNVVMSADGPVLMDWDLLSAAPAGWDHAPLMTWSERWGGAPGIYEAFADGYEQTFRGDPIAEGYAELRLLAATLMRLRAGRSDPAARVEAERRLAYWRGDPRPPMWTAQ